MTFTTAHSNKAQGLARRSVLIGAGGLALTALLPAGRAHASAASAKARIDQVIAEILSIVNSGQSESAMLSRFEQLFGQYADVPTIGRLVLGPLARSISDSQNAAFARAFQTYMARKYGRRFREFIGGRVEVGGAKTVNNYHEVASTVYMQGTSPFELIFVVRDSNDRFIDLRIEGVSLIVAERGEIGAMLDRRGGDLNQLIAELPRM